MTRDEASVVTSSYHAAEQLAGLLDIVAHYMADDPGTHQLGMAVEGLAALAHRNAELIGALAGAQPVG